MILLTNSRYTRTRWANPWGLGEPTCAGVIKQVSLQRAVARQIDTVMHAIIY